MKILFITTTLASFPGDPNAATGNCWLDFLIEISKKHDVTVITPLKKDNKPREKIGNLKIIRVGPVKPSLNLQSILTSFNFWRLPLMFFNMFLTAKKLNKEKNFDIIHSFFIIPNAFLISLIKTKCPKLVTCLGSDVHTWSYFPLIKQISSYVLKRQEVTICVAKSLIPRVKELGAKKVVYVPTPIKISEFLFSKKCQEENSIVFIGRLIKKKGIYVLVEAIDIVKRNIPDIKVYVCADGPERSKLEKIIKIKGLQKNIKLLGFVDRKKLIDYIKKSKAFILPSYAEGMPSSILEAMSIGRPVIVTDVGDLRDLITSDFGSVSKIGDSKTLAENIIKCLKKEWDAHKIRRKAEEFDIKHIINEYENIYKKLLK